MSRRLAASLWAAEQCQNKVQGRFRVTMEPPSFFFFLTCESAKLFWPKLCAFEVYADNRADTCFSPQGLWWTGSRHQTSAQLQMSQKAFQSVHKPCFPNHLGYETDIADRRCHMSWPAFSQIIGGQRLRCLTFPCVCATRHTSDLLREQWQKRKLIKKWKILTTLTFSRKC